MHSFVPHTCLSFSSKEEADEFLKNIAQETTAWILFVSSKSQVTFHTSRVVCVPIPQAAASPPLQEYMPAKAEEVESEVVDLHNHEAWGVVELLSEFLFGAGMEF